MNKFLMILCQKRIANYVKPMKNLIIIKRTKKLKNCLFIVWFFQCLICLFKGFTTYLANSSLKILLLSKKSIYKNCNESLT